MPAPELLDLSRLEIALGGDTSLIGDILQMYEGTAADDLASLDKAVSSGDLDQVTRRAHSLKGASANVGADAVAQLAATIERSARAGSLEQAAARLPQLHQVFADTMSACQAHRAA